MKVIIKVWLPDKPHEPCEGMPMETILEYDKFDEPEVIGHDILIERCRYNTFSKELLVYFDEYPARIDADPRYKTLHILHADRASFYPEAYTTLDADKGKGIILWTNPNKVIAEVS